MPNIFRLRIKLNINVNFVYKKQPEKQLPRRTYEKIIKYYTCSMHNCTQENAIPLVAQSIECMKFNTRTIDEISHSALCLLHWVRSFWRIFAIEFTQEYQINYFESVNVPHFHTRLKGASNSNFFVLQWGCKRSNTTPIRAELQDQMIFTSSWRLYFSSWGRMWMYDPGVSLGKYLRHLTPDSTLNHIFTISKCQ